LYRTAMNLIRSKHRRSLMMARRQPEPIVSSDPFPGLVVRLDLVTALGQLTRRQRAALVLTDLLGFSSDDVGEMLSLSPSTVRVHAARGRAVLKEALGHG
jgi:DNA-directed RNA polymerase specialized sigma24 family protein